MERMISASFQVEKVSLRHEVYEGSSWKERIDGDYIAIQEKTTHGPCVITTASSPERELCWFLLDLASAVGSSAHSLQI